MKTDIVVIGAGPGSLMAGNVVDRMFYEAIRYAEQIKAERPEVYEKLLKIKRVKG